MIWFTLLSPGYNQHMMSLNRFDAWMVSSSGKITRPDAWRRPWLTREGALKPTYKEILNCLHKCQRPHNEYKLIGWHTPLLHKRFSTAFKICEFKFRTKNILLSHNWCIWLLLLSFDLTRMWSETQEILVLCLPWSTVMSRNWWVTVSDCGPIDKLSATLFASPCLARCHQCSP